MGTGEWEVSLSAPPTALARAPSLSLSPVIGRSRFLPLLPAPTAPSNKEVGGEEQLPWTGPITSLRPTPLHFAADGEATFPAHTASQLLPLPLL